MKLLAIFLIILGISKLYIITKTNWEDFKEKISYFSNIECIMAVLQGYLLTDIIVSLICGIYILFI